MNEEQNIKQLPKDWKWVKLGEACNIISGKNQSKVINPKGKYPIYGSSGIFGYADEYICNEGTTIIGRKGTINNPLYVSTKFWNVDTAFGLSPNENYNNKLLYYFCLSYNFHKLDKSTTIPSLAKTDLLSIDIPLPPKPTQQAIVSKIEELFSELDKGIENLHTAQQQLKTYRQSVLNTLVTGKNCQTIESVIKKLDQGWSPKCENEASTDKTEWAVIKTSAVQHGYFLEFENKRLPKDLKPKEQHELKAGDILITRAGPRVRVGVCCMIKHTRPKLINCDKVYRIKVNNKIVIPEYFEFILNTPQYQDEIEKMKSGISDSGLNLTQKAFLQITIPVPIIEEQNKIVQEIESRLSVADKLEESITQSLQQAEALRQSILKKAFEGRLQMQFEQKTPQNRGNVGQHRSNVDQHQSDVDEHQSDVDEHQSDVDEHQSDVDEHQSDVDEHQSDVDEHQSDVDEHQSDVDEHQSDVDEHQGDVDEHQSDVDEHQSDVHQH
jgi:type I restriction enzyme, S subunit